MKKLALFIAILSLTTFPILTYAHSGNTDSSGGHHDYQNKSGLGSYHYHHGYGPHLHSNGVCPYGGGSSYNSAASGSYNSNSSSSNKSSSVKITEKPDSPVKVGESITLDTNTYEDVTWKSSNKKIATVNSSGKVKAVGAGKVTISVTTNNGAKDSFTLTIEEIKIESLEPVDWPSKMTIGDAVELLVDIEPNEATDKTLEWKSSNTEVATISEDGQIFGAKVGFADITVGQGDISVHKIIQIVPEIETIEIKPDSDTIELEKDDSITLTVTSSPSNALIGDIKWESDNPKVAIVDKNGKVTAKSSGKASVIATTENGKTDVIIIEVKSYVAVIVCGSLFLLACVVACIIGVRVRHKDKSVS